jgi:hypothetical protein
MVPLLTERQTRYGHTLAVPECMTMQPHLVNGWGLSRTPALPPLRLPGATPHKNTAP